MSPARPVTECGVRIDRRDAVVTVTLDRPRQLNAQTPEMWEALAEIRRDLDGDVRVVVLRGAGRAFSSGLDRDLFTAPDGLRGLAASDAGQVDEQIAAWQTAFDWSSRPDLTSIAAVHGHAIGAGFQLALGADLRVIADDTQFAMPEAVLGLVPDLGGTKRLVDLVGRSCAMEICLTGRRIDADEAVRLGLASRVVARAGLDAVVQSTIESLLAVDRDAATETKALLAHASRRTQDEQQAAERAAQYRRLRALAGLDEADSR